MTGHLTSLFIERGAKPTGWMARILIPPYFSWTGWTAATNWCGIIRTAFFNLGTTTSRLRLRPSMLRLHNITGSWTTTRTLGSLDRKNYLRNYRPLTLVDGLPHRASLYGRSKPPLAL